MPRVKLEVRQSHTILQAAVGSLVHIGGHSLVPCDTRYWEDAGEPVDMPRLSRALGRSFRAAPVLAEHGPPATGDRLPVVRFPGWLFCPRCRTMYAHPRGDGQPAEPILCPEAACRKVESTLAPMPWILVCRNGHMEDLPWQHLVHRDAKLDRQRTCRDVTKLFFRPAGARSRRARVVCEACQAALDLHALRGRNFLMGVSCPGRQPWDRRGEPCDARAENGSLAVAGLGDHFVHYPVVTSALDIPPESRLDPRNDVGIRLRAQGDWRPLQELFRTHGAENAVVQQRAGALARSTGVTPDIVMALLEPAQRNPDPPADLDAPMAQSRMLRAEEYSAFLREIGDYREYERFITTNRTRDWTDYLQHGELSARARRIGARVSALVAAPRLREVRALKGFTRVEPMDATGVRMVHPDLDGKSPWLPAAEFFGEGLFFTLDAGMLDRWVQRPAVEERTGRVRERYEASLWRQRLAIGEDALPVLIAVHTFTHLLIREMAFECGYPAASLRERLYVTDGDGAMTGALVYLAAGDPGGSLGGLAELAEPERFLRLLLRCVEAAQWCALDPVCGEHEGRGNPPLNRAACHACCLLAETSCECGNLLLDRELVASPTGVEMTGFFDES